MTTPTTPVPGPRPDANQLLLTGGKAPESVDFGSAPPFTIGGKVLSEPTTYHAREFDRLNPGQGPLRYWPDGNPVYGVYLDLEIVIPAPVGIRRLYVEKLRMTTAIQAAMLRAGVHRVDAGGFLSVTWTGTEAGQGNLPANTYVADYTKPGALPPANNILSGNGTTAQLPQSAPAAWQQGTPGAVNGNGSFPQSQPQQPQPAFPQPQPVQHYAQSPAPTQPYPPTVQPQPVLTETIATAMRNAGIPTDGYVIVPG